MAVKNSITVDEIVYTLNVVVKLLTKPTVTHNQTLSMLLMYLTIVKIQLQMLRYIAKMHITRTR